MWSNKRGRGENFDVVVVAVVRLDDGSPASSRWQRQCWSDDISLAEHCGTA